MPILFLCHTGLLCRFCMPYENAFIWTFFRYDVISFLVFFDNNVNCTIELHRLDEEHLYRRTAYGGAAVSSDTGQRRWSEKY